MRLNLDVANYGAKVVSLRMGRPRGAGMITLEVES